MRFLDWGVKRTPFFAEPVLVAGYTLVIFALAGRQRRAVMANLAVLRPRASWFGRLAMALGVFWEFAWMLTDSAHARGGERNVTWRLDGAEAFRFLREDGGAALILTAHMGNYDVAAPFFASRLGRRLHGVRVPERHAEMQAYMEEQRARQESADFRVRYNHPDSFLGVELARALGAGEIVALQGDRVVDQVSPVEVVWEGKTWPLPVGPFVLAQAGGAPVFPIFIVRDGWRSYRVLVLPPRTPEPAVRGQRARQQQDLIAWWAGVLSGVIRQNATRWLMFDPAFLPREKAEADAVTVVPHPVPHDGASSPEMDMPWPVQWRRRSLTALGQLVDRALGRDAVGDPRLLVADDPAQNPWETGTLAVLLATMLGCGVYFLLQAAGLPAWLDVAVTVPTAFLGLQAALVALGAVADATMRLAGHRCGWSVIRVTETLGLAACAALAAALLWTPAAALGAAWLALAAVNTLSFFLVALSRGSRPD